MAKWSALFVTAAVVTALAPVPVGAQTTLYTCEGDTGAAARVGVTLCNATPTDVLITRTDIDNLQVRSGALVVELGEEGVASAGGLQTGDMIYRVGGVDVADSASVIDALNAIGNTSDTVVNFLRGGRPYRVKLRTE